MEYAVEVFQLSEEDADRLTSTVHEKTRSQYHKTIALKRIDYLIKNGTMQGYGCDYTEGVNEYEYRYSR